MKSTNREPRGDSVFSLKVTFPDPIRQGLFTMMRRSLERFLLLDQVNELYEAAKNGDATKDFMHRLMVALKCGFEISDRDRRGIPPAGTALVVANHPFGGIEGVILMALLKEVRPDVKVMANYLLGRMPEMRDMCIMVDPFGGRDSSKRNIRPMKEAIRWLRDGHMLLIFPSGEVSHLNLARRCVEDPKWSPTIAGLVKHTQAPVLPMFVEGCNSAAFQVMGLLHPRIRTAMLARELFRKTGGSLRFRVGSMIPFARLKDLGDEDLMDYLRLRTYLLMSREEAPRPRRKLLPFPLPRPAMAEDEPVASALDPALVAEDIFLLPPDRCLLETEDCAVYIAAAPQIPRLLHELGRLREVTFRAAGEGTGKALDLDRFDQHYLHLLLWSRKNNELIGAYRIGQSDVILPAHGLRGLYTSTLFRYRADLLRRMGPALEMGRSFIRAEYQKNYTSLLLLWKGIGRFIAQNPRYRHLFGPVSINNEYKSMSRQMMESFLRANNFNTDWARYVKPRNRRARPQAARWNPDIFRKAVTSPEQMAELLSEIEKDQKGVPVLLKQYLKLGGKLLGFNVDPQFSDVLDGLIWVDLADADPRILERFIGKAEGEKFLQLHGRSRPVAEPGTSPAAAPEA